MTTPNDDSTDETQPVSQEPSREVANVSVNDSPLDAFPAATPAHTHMPPPRAEWKRYLFPVFLVGIAAIVVGFLLLDAQRQAARKMATSTNVKTDTITYEERVAEAEEIMQAAEIVYTEGYEGIDDLDVLRKSRVMYAEAWKLLTGREWNSEFPKLNESAEVLHDSSKARILRNDAYNKLIALENSLDGWSWW